MKKIILRYTLLGGLFFLIGFAYTYHLPNFKIWAIDQIEKQSNKYLPVQIIVSDIGFQPFPIGVRLKNIRVVPKKELIAALSTSYIEELELSINPFSFFTGLFDFSKIVIRKPQVKILDFAEFEKLKTPKSKDFQFSLKKILAYPIDSFQILDLNLNIEPKGRIPSIVVSNFSFEIENQKTSALISIIAENVKVYDPNIAKIPAEVSIGSRILIQENQILLSALKIKKGDSYIIASGYSESPLNNISFDKLNLRIKSSLKLQQLRVELKPFLSDNSIPQLYGELESQTVIIKKSQEPIKADTKFYFKDLQIDDYIIGQLIGQITYQNDQLQAPIIQMKNNAGTAELHDTSVILNAPNDFKTELKVPNLQLQELLKNLGLGEIKVQLSATGTLPCKGQLRGPTFITCNGEVDLQNFRVYNDKQDIVKVKKGKIKGQVEVTNKKVITTADLFIGENSSGKATGFVDYKDGFTYNYETEKISFDDADISGLDLKGIAKLKGQTKGDSNGAVFNIDTEAKNFYIKNYFLGDLATKMNYLKGTLHFKDVDGLVRITKYLGKLDINLNTVNLSGNLDIPYLELADLQKVFEKIVKLPLEVYGGGRATMSFNGPLDFSLLSYKVQSEFQNGNIAAEAFDKVVFNVTSNKGHVTADDVHLKKSSGLLTLTGTAEPSGHINTKWVGSNFTLQSLNTFNKSEVNIDGNLNFDLSLTEHILSPKSELKAKITQTRISQESVPDSSFALTFEKNGIAGQGQFLGNQINANFIIPYSANSPFKLQAKVDKWNFVPLIHLISSRSRALEFQTLLTGEINLYSPNNGFWNTTGKVNFSEFRVQRGNKEFYAPEPVVLKFTNGILDAEKFFIRGDNTSLELTPAYLSGYPISFGLNGKIDLSLLSFLTPFFDDFRGILALSSQIGFSQNDWKLIGSAFISKGYLRVDEFPHPLEEIETDLIFNDNRIIVNKFIAQFASGKISGDGKVDIKGYRNIPVDLNLRTTNINLKVPPEVSTKGSGEFQITGNYFPYLFEGTYVVQSGLMTKQFEDSEESKTSYARSQLLPKSLIHNTGEIIILDVETVLTKGFDIKNDLLESKIYGKLRIKGPPSSVVLMGPIQLQRGGKLFFRETPFEIETGEIKLNNPNKLNGDIYISAKTVVEESRDNRIQKYDINMIIQGRFDDFRISLSSNPPRSEKDIISLLAIGVTTESYQPNQSQEQVQKQSYEVGASILTKNKFGRELKHQTGLEFKVGSAIDQRSKSSSPKVTVSKQWTPKLGTSASRTFGETGTNDLKVEYQLNKNMSVIGSWEGRETSNSNTQTESKEKDTTDVIGLDLEYKFEFK